MLAENSLHYFHAVTVLFVCFYEKEQFPTLINFWRVSVRYYLFLFVQVAKMKQATPSLVRFQAVNERWIFFTLFYQPNVLMVLAAL